MEKEENKVQRKRDNQGRFDHEGDWDRLCVCGHTLGVHCAGSPADCLLNYLRRAVLQSAD